MSCQKAPAIDSGWPRPWQVLEYFENSLESLGSLQREAASREIRPESRFYGLTPDEFSDAIERTRNELEHQVVLLLTASFEAVLKVDLVIRCRQRCRQKVANVRERHGGPAERHVRQLAVRLAEYTSIDILGGCRQSPCSGWGAR